MTIKLFEIISNSDKYSYSSNLTRDEIFHRLFKNDFIILKQTKLKTNPEKFDIRINSTTSITPPVIKGTLKRTNHVTYVDLTISQHAYLRKITKLFFSFIIIIQSFVIFALIFRLKGLDVNDLSDFWFTTISLIMAGITIPKLLYIYERKKALKQIKTLLKLKQ